MIDVNAVNFITRLYGVRCVGPVYTRVYTCQPVRGAIFAIAQGLAFLLFIPTGFIM